MPPDDESPYKEKKNKKVTIEPGPVFSKDGLPYDYFIVIDAGSKGSRVFVYNWLNPRSALDAGVDLSAVPKVNLVQSKHLPGSSSDDNSTNDALKKFPAVSLMKHWHKKISPGLSSFNRSPQKIGNHHLRFLLAYASAVVPKSQHHRTPIFLHATAGMRLLPPKEQDPILENICTYFSSNSDFFLPDCRSHVNIIDGDIEGLYGWLSINYLVGSFDWPEDHVHGKGHNTYGLLDMGGASTQVVFQPNATETQEHENNLYRVSLAQLPKLKKDSRDENPTVGQYTVPEFQKFSVFSDSFLGFGMFQALSKYRLILVEQYKIDNDVPPEKTHFGTPISDPCLPKGFTTKMTLNNAAVDFTGESDFERCLTSIFPVLANATHGGNKEGDCMKLNQNNKVSACLLNDLIPAFDFDVNHFFGVSGYWDAINALSSYDRISRRKDYETFKNQDIPRDSLSEKYDYLKLYTATSQWCSHTFIEMVERNNARKKHHRIKEDELAELCFKASWILNFLHVGLGFPRIGIDEVPNKDSKFKSLQLVEDIGELSFSWTLGRAVLYANDEYVQAFNNYTVDNLGVNGEIAPLDRPGFLYTPREDAFHYGAESPYSYPRPLYTPEIPGTKYPHFDYENEYIADPHELSWYLNPHRYYGGFVLIILVVIIIVLMMGRKGRVTIADNCKTVVNKLMMMAGRKPYFAYDSIPADVVRRSGSFALDDLLGSRGDEEEVVE